MQRHRARHDHRQGRRGRAEPLPALRRGQPAGQIALPERRDQQLKHHALLLHLGEQLLVGVDDARVADDSKAHGGHRISEASVPKWHDYCHYTLVT
ncbi:hypothetical protein D3C78_1830840 [compost metagenome]